MQKQSSDQRTQQILSILFDMFDKDKSGTLNIQELSALLNKLFAEFGEPMRLSPWQIQLLMKEADVNKDGVCSKQELFDLQKRLHKINLNALRFGPALAASIQQEQQKKESLQQNPPAKFEPPTLNMDENFFEKLSEELKNFDEQKNTVDDFLRVFVDKILEYYDKDNSGALETAEAINFLRAMDAKKGKLRHMPEFQLNLVISYMDPNKDGKLDRQELIQFFKKSMETSMKEKQLASKTKANTKEWEPGQSRLTEEEKKAIDY